MNRQERNPALTGDAIVVAMEIFEMFRVVGDKTYFDMSAAIDRIEAYGNERVRASWRPHRARIVPLRAVKPAR